MGGSFCPSGVSKLVSQHLEVRDKAFQCMPQAPNHKGPRGIDDRSVRGTQDMGDKTLWLRASPYVAMALVPCD